MARGAGVSDLEGNRSRYRDVYAALKTHGVTITARRFRRFILVVIALSSWQWILRQGSIKFSTRTRNPTASLSARPGVTSNYFGDVTSGHGDVIGRQTRQRCDRIFSLLHRHYDWAGGESADPADSCAAPSIPDWQASRCLHEAAARRRRPSRIVFVGDSRNRILYNHLRQRLQLEDVRCQPRNATDAPSDTQRPLCTDPGNGAPYPDICLEIFYLAGQRNHLDKLRCSQQARGPLLSAEFWWRSHIKEAFVSRLEALRDECASPQGCADLVVLDAGMWYAGRKVSGSHNSGARTRATLEFQNQLPRLEPALSALSALTRVVWKLEEPVSEMFSKSHEQSTFNVLHSLLHELQARNVCLQLRKVRHKTFIPVRGECYDETHVGKTLLAYYSNHVINFLCQDTPALQATNSCCRR
ncbi:uncharacterized protein LOC119114154 [Pollicipes pollicipes]|uniref:uncharacterized protein LOC119114154 n=1 Tax=Pollicipes pollicipes TaxID=41117 RepID=UPI0018854D6F|nr:uncharacterized protein LOC119114154 [Pollicipes pollicipes]